MSHSFLFPNEGWTVVSLCRVFLHKWSQICFTAFALILVGDAETWTPFWDVVSRILDYLGKRAYQKNLMRNISSLSPVLRGLLKFLHAVIFKLVFIFSTIIFQSSYFCLLGLSFFKCHSIAMWLYWTSSVGNSSRSLVLYPFTTNICQVFAFRNILMLFRSLFQSLFKVFLELYYSELFLVSFL